MITLRFVDGFYTPPSGGALVLRFGGVELPTAPPKPDFIVSMIAPWGLHRKRSKQLVGAWAGAFINNRSQSVSMVSQGKPLIANLHIEPALDLSLFASAYAVSFGGWEMLASEYSLAWLGPNLRFSSSGFISGANSFKASGASMPWHGPNLHFRDLVSRSGNGFEIHSSWFMAWSVPKYVQQNGSGILWAYRFTPPYCVHEWKPLVDAPGGSLVLRFPPGGAYTAPSGGSIVFVLDITKEPIHCYERDESGPKTGAPPPIPPSVHIVRRPFDLEVYDMSAAITMKRLSDNAPIEVLRAGVSIDVDSFTWSLSAELASQADLDLVHPSGSELVAVEIVINSQPWRFLVDRARTGKRFNQKTFSVTGRSLAAELAAPDAPVSTYTQSAGASAYALAIASVPFDWVIDWQIVDWELPIGSLTYTDKTPIEIVTMIASAAGGVVQADPVSKTLHIISRYPVSPWDWSVTPPDIAINDLIVKSLDSDWQPGPPYNRVFVSGEHAGNLLQLTRDGTAGDQIAPTIVDRLLTHVQANRERGRVELSKSGRRSIESINLPLATPPAEPALITPGTLIEVTDDGSTWRGLVLSTAIDAVRESAVVANQSITVERFYT